MRYYKYNKIYILLGLSISLSSMLFQFLIPYSDEIDLDCDVDTTCKINPNYSANFADCQLAFFNVWKTNICNDEFFFSNDGGMSWTEAKAGNKILQNGISNCAIIIKASENSKTFRIKNTPICNCGPCVPSDPSQYSMISDFINDPTSSYLSFNNCCCKDYLFTIGGDDIPAILLSLKLHVDYLNGLRYSISSVDDKNKKVYLVEV